MKLAVTGLACGRKSKVGSEGANIHYFYQQILSGVIFPVYFNVCMLCLVGTNNPGEQNKRGIKALLRLIHQRFAYHLHGIHQHWKDAEPQRLYEEVFFREARYPANIERLHAACFPAFRNGVLIVGIIHRLRDVIRRAHGQNRNGRHAIAFFQHGFCHLPDTSVAACYNEQVSRRKAFFPSPFPYWLIASFVACIPHQSHQLVFPMLFISGRRIV